MIEQEVGEALERLALDTERMARHNLPRAGKSQKWEIALRSRA